jgi:hypothetical protein
LSFSLYLRLATPLIRSVRRLLGTDVRKPRVTFVLFAMGVACGSHSPQLTYDIPEYRGPEFERPPNGEPESVRYQVAYGAFFWNCVFVKSESLEARCPFTCSGTPGAAVGCADGATAAEQAIDTLAVQFDSGVLKSYLVGLANSSDAKERIRPYFGDNPRPDRMPK